MTGEGIHRRVGVGKEDRRVCTLERRGREGLRRQDREYIGEKG